MLHYYAVHKGRGFLRKHWIKLWTDRILKIIGWPREHDSKITQRPAFIVATATLPRAVQEKDVVVHCAFTIPLVRSSNTRARGSRVRQAWRLQPFSHLCFVLNNRTDERHLLAVSTSIFASPICPPSLPSLRMSLSFQATALNS